jgi:hypothetical protein
MEARPRHRHWFYRWEAIAFAFFAVFVVLSNQDDWDFFLGTLEVDRRSWLLDGAAPLWSYQLCAGSTRIGDPQAFGLSPLFLVPLALGSFWGAKALVLLLTGLGIFGLRRLFRLAGDVGGESRVVTDSLAFFVLFGSYYFAHILGGQLTFALMPLAFCLCALVFGAAKERPRPLPLAAIFLASLCFFSAGFYHALVFLALPGSLLLTVALALRAARGKLSNAGTPRGWLFALAPAAAGFAAASYKWLAVLRYQQNFPRVTDPVPELSGLSHLLVYFFVPLIHLRFGNVVEFLGNWGPGEYTAFGFPPIACAIAIAWLWRYRRDARWRELWLPELALVGFFALLLCLGDSSPLPLHSLLNRFVYHGSVRVIGRYHILLIVLMALFLVRVASAHEQFRAFYLRRLLPFGFAVSGICLFSFLPLESGTKFFSLLSFPARSEPAMTELAIVPGRMMGPVSDSFMYPFLLRGDIVLNCYQAIQRETRVASEQGSENAHLALNRPRLPLLSPGASPVSEACRASAYVTQNDVRYDARLCPSDLCFALNSVNAGAPLVFRADRGLYCVP